MKVGEVRELDVTAADGYGDKGYPDAISSEPLGTSCAKSYVGYPDS